MIHLFNGKLWYCCPHCGKKFFPVSPDAACHGIFVTCKQCKRVFEVKISCNKRQKGVDFLGEK